MSTIIKNRVLKEVASSKFSQTVTDLSWTVAQVYAKNITDKTVENYTFNILEMLDNGALKYGDFYVVELPEAGA